MYAAIHIRIIFYSWDLISFIAILLPSMKHINPKINLIFALLCLIFLPGCNSIRFSKYLEKTFKGNAMSNQINLPNAATICD